MTFKVGDTVTWTSQSHGSTKTKVGVVIHIVPKKMQLIDVIDKEALEYYNTSAIRDSYYAYRYNYAVYRNHESYLVAVSSSEKGKPKLYWPLVNKLRLVE